MDIVMIVTVVVISVLLYAASALDSGKTRIERLRTSGTPSGVLPLPVMTPEFEERAKRRARHEKRAVGVTLIIGAAILIALVLSGREISLAPLFAYLLAFAWVGRIVANSIDRTREVEQAQTDAPRVAHGHYTSLASYYPRPYMFISWGLTAVLIGLMFYVMNKTVPGSWVNYVFLPVSIAVCVASWLFTAWIARQPVYANSEADLRWEDRLISEDVQTLPYVSSLFPMMLALIMVPQSSAEQMPWPLVITALAVFFATLVVGWFAGRASLRQLWPDPWADEHGPNAKRYWGEGERSGDGR